MKFISESIKNLHRALWMVAGILVFAGCNLDCKPQPPPGGVEGAHALAEVVPARARAVVYGESLAQLLGALQVVSMQVPVELPKFGEGEKWRSLGASLDAPALAYWSDSQIVVVSWADHKAELAVEDAWAGSAERRAIDPGMRDGAGWREYDEDGRWTNWVSTDGRRIAVGWSLGEEIASLDRAIWQLEERHRKIAPEKVEFLAERAEESVVHGVIRAGELVRKMEGSGRALFLREHLAKQIGDVFWSASVEEEGSKLRLELLTPGGTNLPMLLEGLGEAEGELPALGGLARPGILGIVRLSVDPEQLLELVRMMMTPEDRGRLDQIVVELHEGLQLDVKTDIMDNINGHIAVVLYGLEDSFFELEGMERVGSLARLQSTREAVLVPFKDRERMETVFNIFTQLSRGKLRRQVIRHTIQYAWFDDGALMWAVILNDEHLLFVDSAVAFSHASAWERTPGQLGGALDERGVDKMLESESGMATYLDLSTIRGLLDQGGMPELAQWMESVDAIKVEMDVEGRRDRSTVEVWSSGRTVERAEQVDKEQLEEQEVEE